MFIAEAVIFAVLGVVLAVSPSTAVRMWPWALTRGAGAHLRRHLHCLRRGALLAANERRAAAVRPFAVSSLVLVGTTAVVSIVHHAKFDGGPSTWVWAAGLAIGVIVFAAASAATLRRTAA